MKKTVFLLLSRKVSPRLVGGKLKNVILVSIFLINILNFYAFEINISPSEKKQSSEIYLKKGDKITIKTSGSWSLWDKYKPVTAAGHQLIANEYGNWGLLLASIGGGKPFVIGEQKEFIAEEEGVLYLFPNKGNLKIINPTGSITTSIEGGTLLPELKKSLETKGIKLVFDPKNKILATNLIIEENKEIEIYAFGNWSMWENVYSEVQASGHEFSVSGVNWGKLYAGIGTSYGYFNEVFPIGEKNSFKASKKGLLSLFPYMENLNSLPSGSLEIYIIGAKEASIDEKNSLESTILTDLQTFVLYKFNDFRTTVKLPLLEKNPVLTKTAFSHAKYILSNKVFSQEEEEGKPFFTGKNINERLSKENYTRKPREILCLAEDFSDAVDLIINSVYHRIRLMDPNLKYLGYGFYKNTENAIHVFDFSYLNDNEEKPVWDTVVYPQNNQTGISISWNGIESPDPFPLGTIKPLGYPVTILCSKKISKINKAELMDEKGNITDSFILSADTDLNNKKFNGVVLVPKKVLNANTRYLINIEILYEKEDIPVKYNWSFITKAE